MVRENTFRCGNRRKKSKVAPVQQNIDHIKESWRDPGLFLYVADWRNGSALGLNSPE